METHDKEASQSPNAPLNGNSSSEKFEDRPHPFALRGTILERIQALGSKCIFVWWLFKSCRDERKRTKKPPGKQPPFNLSFWGLLLLLVFEILILITITVLWILTVRRNGFVDVPDTPSSLIGNKTFRERLLWALALLWTFVPAFIVSMCGKFFAETLQVLEDCQPTIELRKQVKSGNTPRLNDATNSSHVLPLSNKAPSHPEPKKPKAKLSILLDYGSYKWPFQDSYHALRNKHFLICACTTVKWFFAAVGPLASAIISVGSVPASKSVQVTTSTFFDDWRNESSTRPAFEIASAVLLNNGSPYPWSTEIYSVVPFTAEVDTTGNLTAKTDTFSATLDCVEIDVDSLLIAGNITRDWQNTTDFTFVDRGCTANPWIGVSPDPPLYSKVSYVDCPYAAGQARLVLMTGKYNLSSSYRLSEFSLISCIPQFWDSTSLVSVPSGSNGQIVEIIPNWSSVQPWWPYFANNWLWQMPNYKVQDPSQSIDADNFGFIAYNLAKKSSGTSNFAQAMNVTFSAIFATFATISTYSDLLTNSTFPATLSQPGNRLFVVALQAAIVTLVMALSFVVTLWVAVFAYQHRDILREHWDLVLGDAILLEGNEGVGDFVTRVREDFKKQVEVANGARAGEKTWKPLSKDDIDLAVKNGDLVKYAENTRSLNEWNCWVDGDGKLWMKEPVPTSNST
jgi:Protein of unknown function (DUF3433)